MVLVAVVEEVVSDMLLQVLFLMISRPAIENPDATQDNCMNTSKDRVTIISLPTTEYIEEAFSTTCMRKCAV